MSMSPHHLDSSRFWAINICYSDVSQCQLKSFLWFAVKFREFIQLWFSSADVNQKESVASRFRYAARQLVSSNKQCSHSVSSSRYCSRRSFKRLLLKKAVITSINTSLNGSFVVKLFMGRGAIEKRAGKVAVTRIDCQGKSFITIIDTSFDSFQNFEPFSSVSNQFTMFSTRFNAAKIMRDVKLKQIFDVE